MRTLILLAAVMIPTAVIAGQVSTETKSTTKSETKSTYEHKSSSSTTGHAAPVVRRGFLWFQPAIVYQPYVYTMAAPAPVCESGRCRRFRRVERSFDLHIRRRVIR